MSKTFERIETKLIHAGEPEPRIEGAVTMPVFQSATFLSGTGADNYHDVRYVRLNNTPNHDALHAKMAALENAEAALVTSSGMAAISTTLRTFLSSGDHLLVQNCLYGGTHELFTLDYPELGIEHDVFDPRAPDTWAALLRPTTKVIYAETITNPLMEVGELDAIAAFARQHGLISMIDNTFASPINFRPAEHGFDLSLHSATKYLNGHSDIAAGVAIGPADLIERVRLKLNLFGGTLDPHACFLLNRGVKTLALRVRAQCDNAQRIAEFLDAHPRVAHVNYPGLASDPDHERATTLLDGFGGMLSFEVDGDASEAQAVMGAAQIAIDAPSLGGPETLVTRPSATSHACLTPQERETAGISDGLIRMSVGIEAAEDLIADLAQALEC